MHFHYDSGYANAPQRTLPFLLIHISSERQEFRLVCVGSLDHVSVIPFCDKHSAVCLTVCRGLLLLLTAKSAFDLGSGVLYGKPAVIYL